MQEELNLQQHSCDRLKCRKITHTYEKKLAPILIQRTTMDDRSIICPIRTTGHTGWCSSVFLLIKHRESDRRVVRAGGVVGNLRVESIFQSNVFICVLATVVGE